MMGRGKSGFTLVEAMISVMVLGVMLLLTLQAFNVGTRVHDVVLNQTRVSGGARMAIERITRELRNSRLNRINIPSSSVLQFQVPSAIDNNSGNITWSGWIQYSLGGIDNQQLIRQDLSSGTSRAIANKISSLQFVSNSNPATLTISMTVQAQSVYGILTPATLSGTVDFRN